MKRQGVITKTSAHSFFPLWVRHRELRQQTPLGHSDSLYKSLYSSISPCHSWDGGESSRSEYGGVFSLEFSPDGTHLVATCEMFSFQIFDPLSRKLIHCVQGVHSGYVTHAKFLNSRIFATGGDEGEVFLWDIRNVKSRYQSLLGHSQTIGNIEFSRKTNMLITSALDGISYIWDLKHWEERGKCNSSYMSHVLQRLRLNPDETKMVISTSNGYLLIIHELELNTLVKDLMKFELETFGFEYLRNTNSNSGENSSRRRNRVEMVADFPSAGAMISALEIHPQGWSAFSRSKCEKNRKEWTCVHDIQEQEPSKDRAPPREGSGDEGPPRPQRLETISEERRSAREECTGPESVGFGMGSGNDAGSELPDAAFSQERGSRDRRTVSLEDTARARSPPPRPSIAPPHPREPAGVRRNRGALRVLDHLLPRLNPHCDDFNRRLHPRFPRLTHFIEEPFCSDGYMESLGVSPDGRLVCSPLKRGIRLLAFSPECSEQSVSWCGTKPRRLHELRTHFPHSDKVLCTKFSPRECLLVSGCSDGKLAWYQPVL